MTVDVYCFGCKNEYAGLEEYWRHQTDARCEATGEAYR
jgi:hypothetical protein